MRAPSPPSTPRSWWRRSTRGFRTWAWANISVSVSAKALLAYHAAARANASKLPANPLAFLAEMSDERIRRMQEQLLHYRWAMAYRRPAAPSAVHSIAQELQEHVSQNPVRQS